MPPEIDPRYRLDPSILNQYMQYAVPSLMDFSRGQSARGVFTGGQPQAQRSVEDIMSRVQSEELKVYHGIPIETYKEIGGDPTQSGAFHQGDNIYIREGSSLQGSLGHELGHELYSHYAGHGGVPKLSKYQELDLKLGGWLPSISKYGVRPPSIFPKVKGIANGGTVDSTDYGLFQINDKVWNNTSQKFFGKNTQRLSPEENIKMASWIVKNSPRTVGRSTSGWNNWSVILNDSYKKYLNKSDAFYMAGGLSKSNLRLIEQEFGDQSSKAKAVMFAESSGKHSSINQNLSGGKDRKWYNERMRSGAGAGQPYNPEFADAPFNLLNQSIINQLPEEFRTKLSKIKPQLDAPSLQSRTTLMADPKGFQEDNVGQTLLNLIKQQRAGHGGTL